MVGIGIWGEENIKNLFQKNEIYYLKIIEKQMFFLNIFLYITNITYIDINNKMKLKPKPISDIPKESKHKTECWNENKIINDENLN